MQGVSPTGYPLKMQSPVRYNSSMNRMKRILFFAFCCLACVGYCGSEKVGKLVLQGSDTINLGEYPGTEEKTARIPIKNAGESTLSVNRIVATCKCMRVDAYPATLAPGAEGEVAVSIMKNEVFGSFERVFFIESSDPDAPCVRVKIRGVATPLFTVTCEEKTDLGSVDVGKAWTGHYLIQARERGLSLGTATIQNQGTRCVFTIVTNLAERVSYHVTQTVTVEKPGVIKSTILFPVFGKQGETLAPVVLSVGAGCHAGSRVISNRSGSRTLSADCK